jgi:hypothetical protein
MKIQQDNIKTIVSQSSKPFFKRINIREMILLVRLRMNHFAYYFDVGGVVFD